MARINFDDDIESQDEFWNLMPLVSGDRDRALGMIVRFFRFAQDRFGECRVVTEAELTQRGLGVMIQSGWAVPNGDAGYQAKDAEDRFGWYLQRKTAGKRRSNGERDDQGQFQRDTSGSPAEEERDLVPHQPLALSPAPSPVLAPAPALSQNEDLPSASKAERPKVETAATWEAYSVEYELRHKAEPVRNATVNSQMAAFVRRVGKERAPDVAAFFVQHNDYAYVKAMHPVGFLLRDAEKLHTEWKTGQRMTTGQARQADRTQNNLNAFAGLLEASKQGGTDASQ